MAFSYRILNYTLTFRPLTHLEDPGIHRVRESLIMALVTVNDHPLSSSDARRIIETLSDNVISNLWFMYQKELQHGKFTSDIPWGPPEPKPIHKVALPDEEDGGLDEQ